MVDKIQIDHENKKVPQRRAIFTEIAERYDQSRNIPPTQLKNAIKRLNDNGLLPPEAKILDIEYMQPYLMIDVFITPTIDPP